MQKKIIIFRILLAKLSCPSCSIFYCTILYMPAPSLHTLRLTLRSLSEADIEPLFVIFSGEEVLRYFPNPNPPTRQRIERFILHQISHWKQFGYGHWAVEQTTMGILIGWAGLQFLPETGETEVAYLLGRPYWGQGYGTEAARCALEYGFETLGLKQIIALVHPDNQASNHVIEKLGMPFTGRSNYFGMEVNRYLLDRRRDYSE